MRNNTVDQITVGRVTARIEADDHGDASNPRDEDNLGTIAHWHRRYDFGEDIRDEGPNGFMLRLATEAVSGNYHEALMRANIEKILNAHYVILPVALLDHSGLRMWIGSRHSSCDPGGWDSGQVGFIYCSLEAARKNWMLPKAKWDTKIPWKNYTEAKLDSEWRTTQPVQLIDTAITLREATEKVLTGEIENYDSYLSGEVYGYVIDGPDGEHMESCWGFVGDINYVKQEARSMAEHCNKKLDEEDVESHRCACADIATV